MIPRICEGVHHFFFSFFFLREKSWHGFILLGMLTVTEAILTTDWNVYEQLTRCIYERTDTSMSGY